MSVREYRLRPYQVTFREFGDRTTSRGCARRQSTYTERVDRRGSRPGARGQHMGGGGWSRADPVAHKQTRARFLFVGTAAAQCCPARRGRRGARSTAAGRAHAPRLQRDRVHHVEDSRRHRCDERVDDDGLHRRRWCRNRVRRRYVSTSAPGGAGCAAHGAPASSTLRGQQEPPPPEPAAQSRRFRIRIAST